MWKNQCSFIFYSTAPSKTSPSVPLLAEREARQKHKASFVVTYQLWLLLDNGLMLKWKNQSSFIFYSTAPSLLEKELEDEVINTHNS